MIRLLADFSLRTKASPRIRDGLAGVLVKAARERGWSIDLIVPPNISQPEVDVSGVEFHTVSDYSDFYLQEVIIPRIAKHYDLVYTQREAIRLTESRSGIVLHLHEHRHARYIPTPTVRAAARSAWQSYRTGRMYRSADHICFSSAWTRDEFRRLEGFEPASNSIVPLGGWPETLSRTCPGTRKPVVVVVGSSDARDELAWGLEVWEKAKLPDHWEMVVIGEVNSGGDRTRLIGRVSDDQLIQTLARSSAYLHIGRKEGFGLSIVEALQLGTPVVARRGSAVDELLGNGGGYLVDDTRSAAKALQEVADGAISYEAAATAGSQYSWLHTAEGVLAACEAALTV